LPGNDRPITNPAVVLREEFDDWAVLFDPDANVTFGINPTGVYIWKLLNGKRTIGELIGCLRENREGVPDNARKQLMDFIDSLAERGLATFVKG
jgi:SynChlorMet cassette protein ScmD